MSRRHGSQDYLERNDLEGGADILYSMIEWTCGSCEARTGEAHRLGVIVRQRGRDMIGGMGDHPPDVLRRIDGPDGETKVEADCPTCRALGLSASPQVRWERLVTILDEMQAAGEHHRRFCPS